MPKKRYLLLIILLLSIFFITPTAKAEEIEEETKTTYQQCFENVEFNRTLLGDYKNVFITKTLAANGEQYNMWALSSEVKYKLDTNTAYFYNESNDDPYIQYVYYQCTNLNPKWQLKRYGTYDLTNTAQNLHTFSLENKTNEATIPLLTYTNHNLIDIEGNIIRNGQEWIFIETTEPPEYKTEMQKIIENAFNNYDKGAAIKDEISFDKIRDTFIRISNTKMASLTEIMWSEMPNWLWYLILGFILIAIIIALLN